MGAKLIFLAHLSSIQSRKLNKHRQVLSQDGRKMNSVPMGGHIWQVLGLSGLWDETDVVAGGKGSVYPLPSHEPFSRALCQPRGLGAAGRLPSCFAAFFAVHLAPSGALPLVGLPLRLPEAGVPWPSWVLALGSGLRLVWPTCSGSAWCSE